LFDLYVLSPRLLKHEDSTLDESSLKHFKNRCVDLKQTQCKENVKFENPEKSTNSKKPDLNRQISFKTK